MSRYSQQHLLSCQVPSSRYWSPGEPLISAPSVPALPERRHRVWFLLEPLNDVSRMASMPTCLTPREPVLERSWLGLTTCTACPSRPFTNSIHTRLQKLIHPVSFAQPILKLLYAYITFHMDWLLKVQKSPSFLEEAFNHFSLHIIKPQYLHTSNGILPVQSTLTLNAHLHSLLLSSGCEQLSALAGHTPSLSLSLSAHKLLQTKWMFFSFFFFLQNSIFKKYLWYLEQFL